MKTYKVIGLMSGTSLDGLDIAYTCFWQSNGTWSFEIKRCETVSYSIEMKETLRQSIHLKADELLALNVIYGKWLGKQVIAFIEKNKIKVDFIASHGHTVHHNPKQGYTYQLGNAYLLAQESGHRVICDFRNKDIALGGQGAPLVPIGDRLLFPNYDCCLNIGGISNISFEKLGKRVAYDVGLCNMLLNYATQKIGLNYDDKGKLATKGRIIKRLYESLNNLDYYSQHYPKSLGYEWFADKVVPLIDSYNEKTEDLLCTYIHHICEQLASNINKEVKKGSVLVTGGGAYNDFLVSTLRNKLNDSLEIVILNKSIIEYKEALIFAFMGVLKMEGEVNVLSSVTGASRDSVCGVMFKPD